MKPPESSEYSIGLPAGSVGAPAPIGWSTAAISAEFRAVHAAIAASPQASAAPQAAVPSARNRIFCKVRLLVFMSSHVASCRTGAFYWLIPTPITLDWFDRYLGPLP